MFTTPFKDTVGPDKVPTTGSAGATTEPNLPSGMPGRDGGLLPEKLRDTHITPKMPGWISPDSDSHFKWGMQD